MTALLPPRCRVLASRPCEICASVPSTGETGGEGEGCRVMERERVRFVLIPLTVSTIVIELSNVFYMYACIYYYSDNFLTRDYSIKSKWWLGPRLIPNDFHYGH